MGQLSNDIEVHVLTHPAKQPLTFLMLHELGIDAQVYVNPDWDWPPRHPELRIGRTLRPHVRGYALRQYRAFRGHQEILRRADPSKLTLVFEDDAALAADTTADEVLQHLNGARRFIERAGYDAVSFHARNQTPPESSVTLYGREYVELSLQPQEGPGHVYFLQPVTKGFRGKYADNRYRWHEGCLAYLIGPTGREKWLSAGHGSGMPCDLFLANELRTIVMRQTVFKHDHTSGSIIDNHGDARRDLNLDGTTQESL